MRSLPSDDSVDMDEEYESEDEDQDLEKAKEVKGGKKEAKKEHNKTLHELVFGI